MSDATRADVLNRMACVRGHLKATLQMVERGDEDLAIVHQLHAVRGALLKIQIEMLRAQIERWANHPIDPRTFEKDLGAIMKRRNP